MDEYLFATCRQMEIFIHIFQLKAIEVSASMIYYIAYIGIELRRLFTPKS